KAREAANSVRCLSNLRQITLAQIMYANENQGNLPGAVWSSTAPGRNPRGYVNNLEMAGLANWGPKATMNGSPAGNGGVTGMGMLLYGGYLKGLQTCFCPARNPDSRYSADMNLNPTVANTTF